jgi:hypothetical protein
LPRAGSRRSDDARAAVWLRVQRRGGQAEIVESCDEFREPLSVDPHEPLRVLGQHSDRYKRSSIGRDHRSIDPQGSCRIRLAAGVGGVVVDQLDPQLTAESLGGRVDTGGSRHCDPQTLEHESIVPPVGSDAGDVACLSMIDNIELTTQNCCFGCEWLIHRVVWTSPRSTRSRTMLSRLLCPTREVTRLRACHRAHGPYIRLLEPSAPSVSAIGPATVVERDHSWPCAMCSGTLLTQRPARPCQKRTGVSCLDARRERAVPLRLRGAALDDGDAGSRRPPRVGGRSR